MGSPRVTASGPLTATESARSAAALGISPATQPSPSFARSSSLDIGSRRIRSRFDRGRLNAFAPRVLVVASQGPVYSGGLLLALIFGALGWTSLWRAIRGPALQVAENEWIDAAESFGEKPRRIVRKHVAPYVVGYLLIYGSMSIGGVIIGTAGLSYLGIGISSPTPEWGRAVSMGQQYITSPSWHISILPGVAVTVIVIGFNALGDGIRDAIDPQSDAQSEEAAVSAGGGA